MIPCGQPPWGREKATHSTPITTDPNSVIAEPVEPKRGMCVPLASAASRKGRNENENAPREALRERWRGKLLPLLPLRAAGKGCLDSTTRQRGPVWSCCPRVPPSSSSSSSCSSPPWDPPTDWSASARAAPTVESSRKVMTAPACPSRFCIPSTRDPWLPRPFSVLGGSCWSCPNEVVAPCRSPPNRVHKWVWGIQFMLCCLRLPFIGAKREIRACSLPLVLRLTWINSRRARHHRPQTGG